MNTENMDGFLLKKAFEGAVNYLILNKNEVNALNVFPVPDGDTGTNMSLTAKSSIKQIELVKNIEDVSEIAKAAARGSLMGARGNSGVILSQFFRGFSEGLNECEEITTEVLAHALKVASETTYQAVMKPTEGTILTVGREIAEFATKNHKNYTNIIDFLHDIIDEGKISLEKTPEKLKVLKEAGVVDAGGKGLLILLEGAYKTLRGEEIVAQEDELLKKKAQKEINFGKADDSIEFGYCTEFIIQTEYEKLDELREKLSKLGDSLLVVGGNGSGIIKVHVHTNNPGQALELGVELGFLQDIKIDNMRFQHREILFDKEEIEKVQNKSKKEIDKNYSFVVVSMGEGMSSVFKSLGVDEIILGGQTMNPSTEDFLNAIDRTTGKDVFLIPNNSNIILAANQAREVSKRNVHVIETKSIPQGVSAILSFSEDIGVSDNIENMKDALSNVKSAEVTYAVRNTQMNGKDIKKDDIIGISGKEIVACGKYIGEVTKKLIQALVDDNSSMITLYYGEDVNEEDANKLLEDLDTEYDNLDIDLIYGGQPLYYYIISVE